MPQIQGALDDNGNLINVPIDGELDDNGNLISPKKAAPTKQKESINLDPPDTSSKSQSKGMGPTGSAYLNLAKSGINAIGKFYGEHPTLQRIFQGPTEEDLKGTKLNAEGMSPGEIPGLRTGTEFVRKELTRTGSQSKGYIGGLINEWVPGLVEGAFDPSNAGIKSPKIPISEAKIPEVLPPEVTPETPIPSPRSQRLLGSGTYNVNPSGEAGISNLNPEMGFEPLEPYKKVLRNEKGGFTKKPVYSGTGAVDPADIPIKAEPIQAKVESPKVEQSLDDTGKLVATPIETPPVQETPIKLREPVKEYIKGIKDGTIDKGITYSDYLRDKKTSPTELGKRFMKEEEGSLDLGNMFKKVKGLDENEANKIRESIVSSLIQGGKLDLHEIFSKSVGVNKKQFDKIVDEIIDTGITSKIAKQVKIDTPEPITKLLDALKESKINSEAQAAQLSSEKGQRFARFSKSLSKGEGKEGFLKAASQMSGEYGKVGPIEFKLGPEDTDSLFGQIKTNTRITPAEKLRAGFALQDLLEGTRTLQRNELMLMDRIYGNGVGDQIRMMHGGLGGIPIKLAKTANTMKSMNATIDLSAPFRQGLGLVTRKEYWSSFAHMFRYAKSEEAFQALGRSIEEHPNYILSRESGLFTADHSLGNYEEAFMDSYLNDIHKLMGEKAKYSPARASERAYVGFLNKLRFDTFNSLLEKAEKAGLEIITPDGTPTKLANEIAKYINVSTGRGSLETIEKYITAEGLNTVLFSPRLISSRLTILNPKYYIDSPAFVRKEALRTLFGLAGFTVTAGGVGALLGGETKLTPNKRNLINSDFGKIKWDNTRLDPGGGVNQYVTAASQFITNQAVSSTSDDLYDLGKYGQPGRVGKLIGVGNPRYNSVLENKFSPMASLINTIISGKIDPETKAPYSIPIEIRKRFTSLFVQDMMDLYEEDPELLGLGVPASLGMGLQTYGN